MASMTKTYHHTVYPTILPDNPANAQNGRTVLITGAGTGIGLAIAKAFIQAKAARVIITGRRADVLQRAVEELREVATSSSSPSDISYYATDINNDDSVKQLWQSLSDDNISVDVFVPNAAHATTGPSLPLMDLLPDLRASFETNLFANALMTSYFLKSARNPSAPGIRAIVNVSSFMAHAKRATHQLVYGTSKASYTQLLQFLADDIPVEECQIVNFHPGAIMTTAVEREITQEMIDMTEWDNASLPGGFAVWAATPAAAFLHGRFTWSNWDVDELAARKTEFKDDGYMKFGLLGPGAIDVSVVFKK